MKEFRFEMRTSKEEGMESKAICEEQREITKKEVEDLAVKLNTL